MKNSQIRLEDYINYLNAQLRLARERHIIRSDAYSWLSETK